MRRRLPLITLLALGPPASSGCAPDTSIGPEPPTTITILCSSSTCFDEDPCTDDMCQADGSCVHVARNPFGACQTAIHCDDGNPCTDDVCAQDDCGLMRCQNNWRVDCRPCDFGCDDGDPCTPDVCGEDGICQRLDADPHCDPQCRQTAAQSVDVAQWSYDPSGYQALYVGRATPADGLACAGDACTCQSPLALTDQAFTFDLRDATGQGGLPWQCAVEACETRGASCSPLLTGVGYVVWGEMRYLVAREAAIPTPAADTATPSSDAGGMLPPPIDAFEVQGYCLSTRWDHLPGQYVARFESDGQEATFDAALTGPDASGQLVVTMRDCVGCAETGLADAQIMPLDGELGVVSIPVRLTDGAGHARLFARGSELVGDVRAADGSFAGVLTLVPLAR